MLDLEDNYSILNNNSRTILKEKHQVLNRLHPPHYTNQKEITTTTTTSKMNPPTGKLAKLTIFKKPKSFMRKPATSFISIVLFFYILPNPSITTPNYLTNNSSSSSSYDNERLERSLVGLASANPIPEPAPGLRASKSSSTHRIPPINGSIFGKRSVNGEDKAHRSGSRAAVEEAKEIGLLAPIQSQRQVGGGHEKKKDKALKGAYYNSLINSPPAPQASSKAGNYRDIITDIIEDFLALNNDSK